MPPIEQQKGSLHVTRHFQNTVLGSSSALFLHLNPFDAIKSVLTQAMPLPHCNTAISVCLVRQKIQKWMLIGRQRKHSTVFKSHDNRNLCIEIVDPGTWSISQSNGSCFDGHIQWMQSCF